MKNQPVEKLPFPNNIILLFSRLFLSQFVIVNRWKFPKTSCETEHWISVHLFLHIHEVQDDQDTLLLSIERKNYMMRKNVILNSIFSTICSIWVASLFSSPAKSEIVEFFLFRFILISGGILISTITCENLVATNPEIKFIVLLNRDNFFPTLLLSIIVFLARRPTADSNN